MQVQSINLGCPPGYYSTNYTSLACTPCAKGFYSSDVGTTACMACPPRTTTPNTASTSMAFCISCQPGVCVHGRCTVDSGFTPLCTCDSGYSGSDCSTNALAIILGSLFGGLIAIALIAWIVMYVQRRLRTYRTDLSLQEKLLSNANVELQVCLPCTLSLSLLSVCFSFSLSLSRIHLHARAHGQV